VLIKSDLRVWLFRSLILAAVGLILISWFMPWWSADIEELGISNAVVIHPWGLANNMGGWGFYLAGSDMPVWFAPVMWTYLGLAILALLVGSFIRDKSISLFKRKINLSNLIIIVVGFSFIVVAVLAVVVAAIRTGDFGLHLLGDTFVSMGYFEQSWVSARLLPGYWLTCAVGPILIVLGILRSKIIGEN